MLVDFLDDPILFGFLGRPCHAKDKCVVGCEQHNQSQTHNSTGRMINGVTLVLIQHLSPAQQGIAANRLDRQVDA